ncbi:zinc finger protein 112-like [Chrysoperla carnea]|uniref:zinc finger protein 112-like n=1 Tax=Chrysoperla carnea TaxID=189513 RepID=UPI001D07537D|nr:zinc finger protein 112-like [Chrysoperla carnea]
MAKQIIHAGLSTPSRMKNEDFKTAEQKLHTELIIKNEIEVENVPMEFQVIHVINNPLIIKDDDMKIDQDHLIIKDENVDEQSFIYNQSNLQNHTGLEIKRDLKESFLMDLASGNSCIKRESSLHTELILKDEDIEDNHNNSNVDEQSVIDRSNLQNHGLEIKKDLEKSIPMDLASDNSCIKRESSLHTELILKDEDIEEDHNNSNVDERSVIDQKSFQMDLASGNSCIKRESSLHTELILKDEDIEEDHNNSNVDERSVIDQKSFQMDLASGNSCIKRESSLHTELILKDEDIEDNHNNSNVDEQSVIDRKSSLHTELILKDEDIEDNHNNSNVDEQSVIDRSNLQNHGLEIKKDLEKSIPMDLASGNSCIKRESSLHTELILKDEDIEEDHNNSNVDEQSFIDQSNLQNHGLEEINKDLEESVPKGPTNDDLRINNESSLRKELKIKDKDVEKTYENSDLDNLQTVTIQSNLNSPKRDQKGCFSCHLCNKKLTTKYGLSNHYRIHKGEKPYAGDYQERPFLCDKCGKKFLRKSQLEKHDDSVHSDEKRFSCNICDKKYTGKYTLRKKSFFCDVCDKKFSQKHHVTQHKRSHTGEKPYACDVCDKRYFKNQDLVKHKKKHAND